MPAKAAVNTEPKSNTALPPSLRAGTLTGIFAKHPYDGTPKTYFPRLAVTVTDWSRNDCWIAVATIWWSKARSESIAPFAVCWGKSVGFAVNNAANLHLFMQQMAVEHSGNVRTTGPKPPMLAIPERKPFGESKQLAFQGFIEQLLLDTGWQAGAPTNLWLVGYDPSAAKAAPADATTVASNKSLGGKARALLEQALACTAISKRFNFAEAALKQAGWRPEQGVSPIALPEPLKVYGLNTSKIAISRDGGEQTYRSFLPGVNSQQVVKAASLKLGKDGKSYGRATKLGVLILGNENGETTLTCTVDTEGAEG
ncbi:hypothetical protein MasN3_07240 [Massilia varians]|uniref:Uncharacterized protein n=1 Tax=Massilia varians TaxID=457921 RepID=A0ABM8C232_9BURK|nr:hypothetical protein [Massilia varians]BDT57230.1 hypothetical protein MasN3_07240 [Massilia varians]